MCLGFYSMKEQETDISLTYNEYVKLVKRIIQAEAKIIITKELSKKRVFRLFVVKI